MLDTDSLVNIMAIILPMLGMAQGWIVKTQIHNGRELATLQAVFAARMAGLEHAVKRIEKTIDQIAPRGRD